MQSWTRVMLEVYQPDRYEGRWVIEGGDAALDLAYAQSCVRSLRNDERNKLACLQFIEDGDDLVIGVFCGREPPAAPKAGRVLPAELFESTG